MKKLSVYLSLAMAFAGLAACEKNLEEVAQPKAQSVAAAATAQSPKQLLTASTWRQTDFATTHLDAASQQVVTSSLFARFKPAQRDNITQFTTDGRYVLDEGASKVNDAVAQQKNGTYSLSEDGKTLNVTLPDIQRHYTVEELSDNKLRLKLTDGEGASAVSYITTFTH
ncbi:hypothetical protein F0P96_16375 [Hymenobacter busanensis]|uniref:Uncharacterized protein n=1 Tax=Hymenobacter busanensis TaxID=2607656 RepID=A0A7L4ZTI5_9BACT|nr:hypothetical protein [Hymenobacter busanensis]KAA9327556.1 hypothetical protein F0P96_16375 [Hymenobacter busanensis]QHJ06106.1 hypothetical protein GUY19_01860 [Hymenobacter busanensis]